MAHGKVEKYERVDFVETYGVVPYSVWDLKDSISYNNSVEKNIIRDKGRSTRENTARYFGGSGEKTKFTATTSYFNPYLARTIVRSYSKEGDRIFDPFCSVMRPYISMLEGRDYVGCEVRRAEYKKIKKVLKESRPMLGTIGNVKVLNIDCRTFTTTKKFDLVFTCPPYWNHEKYSDMAEDMSTIDSYQSFLKEMGKVAKVCLSVLRHGKFAAIVVGDFRDYSDGRKNIERLVPFSGDTVRVFEKAGFTLYDRVVVVKPLGTAPSRTKLWNNRKTVRIHEDLLVFSKP